MPNHTIPNINDKLYKQYLDIMEYIIKYDQKKAIKNSLVLLKKKMATLLLIFKQDLQSFMDMSKQKSVLMK